VVPKTARDGLTTLHGQVADLRRRTDEAASQINRLAQQESNLDNQVQGLRMGLRDLAGRTGKGVVSEQDHAALTKLSAAVEGLLKDRGDVLPKRSSPDLERRLTQVEKALANPGRPTTTLVTADRVEAQENAKAEQQLAELGERVNRIVAELRELQSVRRAVQEQLARLEGRVGVVAGYQRSSGQPATPILATLTRQPPSKLSKNSTSPSQGMSLAQNGQCESRCLRLEPRVSALDERCSHLSQESSSRWRSLAADFGAARAWNVSVHRALDGLRRRGKRQDEVKHI